MKEFTGLRDRPKERRDTAICFARQNEAAILAIAVCRLSGLGDRRFRCKWTHPTREQLR
jgi:hypothetical protein